MPRKVAPLLPTTNELLRQLGERLRLARLRRRLPAKQLAQRAGMAPMTLRSVERGGSGVTIGAYLAVMQVLGIEKDLELLAQSDPMGRALQDARLSPPHRKTTARKHASSALNPTERTRVGDAASELHQPAQNSAEPQLPKLFESLPTEQMRKVLEALPETQIQHALSIMPSERFHEMVQASASEIQKLLGSTEDARRWIEKSSLLIENSPQEQLRQLFESLPTDQMRTALETLSGAQMHNALAALSSGQMRKTLDVQASAIEKLRKHSEDAKEWFERSGFASSQALADLISAAPPLSRAKRR